MSPRNSSASPPATSADGPHRAPRLDYYTIMLIVAWLALCVGIGLLYVEVMEYGSPPFPL